MGRFGAGAKCGEMGEGELARLILIPVHLKQFGINYNLLFFSDLHQL